MFDYDEDGRINFEAAAKATTVLTKEEVKWGLRYVQDWSDLKGNAEVLPQHADEAYELIGRHLGYLPYRLTSLPHEPFVRALIEEHRQGRLDDKAFQEAVVVHAKHVRNDDMQRNGWAVPCTEQDYHRYNTHLVQFKDRAQQRLMKNMTMELPPLECRLDAEIMLREQYLHDDYTEQPGIMTSIDCMAFTIFFYKMALMEAGRDVANDLDLMGI